MNRSVNYDNIAEVYDSRYERSDYSPVLRLLLEFARGGKCILEVGCGTGQWLSELANYGHHLIGLDPSRNMLKTAMEKMRQPLIIQGCAEAMPFRTEMFDRLFCINAFHHFSQQERFLAEARRVLRNRGGILIVGLDPHTGLDRWWIYDYFPQVIDIDKKRYPSTSALRRLMAEYSFINCNTVEALHMPVQLSARSALESGRLAKTTTSQLAVLTDEEYNEGLRRLIGDIEVNEAQDKDLTIGADLRLYATVGWLSYPA
jgi:ubiquinone/menaquinone biosynthesis C-methylase UbiE